MTQKEKAMECLQQLDINNYVFIRSGKVPVFDSFIARNVCVHEDLPEKIAEIEKRFGCLVYAVTHECFSFGECYSMLVVSKYEEDWPHTLNRISKNCYSAFAWVWNKTDETCSEFGSVLIGCSCGGIVRLE